MKRTIQDIIDEEEQLKKRQIELDQQKIKLVRENEKFDYFVNLSEDDFGRIFDKWIREQDAFNRLKQEYNKKRKFMKRVIEKRENPWRNKVIIGGDEWLLCNDNEKDFIQCKARIKELMRSGDAIFQHGVLSDEINHLKTAEDFEGSFGIDMDDEVDIFINPFWNAKDFYVWGRHFTKEEKKKLIRIKFN